MKIHHLPNEIDELLDNLYTPIRLKRHLRLVHHTALELLSQLKKVWPTLLVDQDLVLFGAATHDIGKTEVREELVDKGKRHEKVGRKILLSHGFPEIKARFAETHGNWQMGDLVIEDFCVALADKLWKGKRVEELEERVCAEIAKALDLDFWDVYLKLGVIFEEITLGSDSRLAWQNEADN